MDEQFDKGEPGYQKRGDDPTEYKEVNCGEIIFTFNVTYIKSKLGICNIAEIVSIVL